MIVKQHISTILLNNDHYSEFGIPIVMFKFYNLAFVLVNVIYTNFTAFQYSIPLVNKIKYFSQMTWICIDII